MSIQSPFCLPLSLEHTRYFAASFFSSHHHYTTPLPVHSTWPLTPYLRANTYLVLIETNMPKKGGKSKAKAKAKAAGSNAAAAPAAAKNVATDVKDTV